MSATSDMTALGLMTLRIHTAMQWHWLRAVLGHRRSTRHSFLLSLLRVRVRFALSQLQILCQWWGRILPGHHRSIPQSFLLSWRMGCLQPAPRQSLLLRLLWVLARHGPRPSTVHPWSQRWLQLHHRPLASRWQLLMQTQGWHHVVPGLRQSTRRNSLPGWQQRRILQGPPVLSLMSRVWPHALRGPPANTPQSFLWSCLQNPLRRAAPQIVIMSWLRAVPGPHQSIHLAFSLS
mmetsp:Transcript_10129/g.30543  ORF Transcript_10129/g.30543 Transcript_10129/m.30543 type:complete len:234 (+) Transcript_10129:1166-1867(+)